MTLLLAGSVTDRIDGVLAGFLDSHGEFLAAAGPELRTVAAAARRCVLSGGKRLRPRFAYWGWRTVKDAEADDTGLLQAAASLELLQACALVHDDIMDDSAVRRGERATHAEFTALHRGSDWPGDADRSGTAAAILIGDLLLTWSDVMFAAAPLPAARTSARAVYDQMRQLVIAGQYLDVLVQNRGGFSVEDALRVARFKTSAYTVEGPLRLGAAAAEAGPEVLAALSGYGAAVGEAFQLRDDVLGVFGDPSRTGKPVGDDLREGKRTLLVALAMRAASPLPLRLGAHCGPGRSATRHTPRWRTWRSPRPAGAPSQERSCWMRSFSSVVAMVARLGWPRKNARANFLAWS